MIETHITREDFDKGCMLTGDRDSWCASADGRSDVRPGTEPGNARFIVRRHLDDKAATIIGRNHHDLACCSNHVFVYVDCSGENGYENVDGYTVFKLKDVTFAS